MTWTLSLLVILAGTSSRPAGGPAQVLHQGLVASVKIPFEQDDWEAWVKFTASVGVRAGGHDLDDQAEMNCQGYGLGIMQLPPA